MSGLGNKRKNLRGTGKGLPSRSRDGGKSGGNSSAGAPASFKSDEEIRNLEDEYKAVTKQTDIHPPRPGFGTRGTVVKLLANFFELSVDPSLSLRSYSTTFTDLTTGKTPGPERRARLMKLLRMQKFSSCALTHDRGGTFVSRQNLPIEGGAYSLSEGNGFSATITEEAKTDLSQTLQALNSKDALVEVPAKDKTLQSLGIVMGYHAKQESSLVPLVGNRYVSENAQVSERSELGVGLIACRAFYMSVRLGSGRFLVNVQPKDMAFHTPGPLVDLYKSFMAGLQSRDEELQMLALNAFVQKMKVRVTHKKPDAKGKEREATESRVKVICGLANIGDGGKDDYPPEIPGLGSSALDTKFWLASKGPGASSSDGRYISVAHFFKEQYGMRLQEPDLPVVNVNSRGRPVYLPLEACTVIFGSVWGKALSAEQTTRMHGFAVRPPNDNKQSIMTNGRALLGLNPRNPTMEAFGLDTAPNMVRVQGRMLPPPKVMYATAARTAKADDKLTEPRSGGWFMKKDVHKFVKPVKIERLVIIGFAEGDKTPSWGEEVNLQQAYLEFKKVLAGKGIEIKRAQFNRQGRWDSSNARGMEATVRNALSANAGDNVFALNILGAPASECTQLYNCIKRHCDITFGIPNVCCLGSKFVKPKADYYNNIALKINLKLGGTNHILPEHELPLVNAGETMVVGLDVTHPSPGSLETAPSIAAIVASINKQCVHFPAAISIQEGRTEMVALLDDLFKSRVALWRKHNAGKLPRNILVFRDGVSDGEYGKLLSEELTQLRSAAQSVYPAADTKAKLPRITIVVMGKRHHTRFYAEDAAGGNTRPGTVVDRGITDRREWDFYLQSHAALQGTARPAHYFVVHDEVFAAMGPLPQARQKLYRNKADVLEDLTHASSYLFARATKAVSKCPPAYYADMVADRVRRYNSRLFQGAALVDAKSAPHGTGDDLPLQRSLYQVHERIRDTMFYL